MLSHDARIDYYALQRARYELPTMHLVQAMLCGGRRPMPGDLRCRYARRQTCHRRSGGHRNE